MSTSLKFNPNKLKYYYKISKMFTLKNNDGDHVVFLKSDGSNYEFGLYWEDDTCEFYRLFNDDSYRYFFDEIVKPTLK